MDGEHDLNDGYEIILLLAAAVVVVYIHIPGTWYLVCRNASEREDRCYCGFQKQTGGRVGIARQLLCCSCRGSSSNPALKAETKGR